MDFIEQQIVSADGDVPTNSVHADENFHNGIGSWLKKRGSFLKKVVKGDFKGVAKDVGDVLGKKKKSSPSPSPSPSVPEPVMPSMVSPTINPEQPKSKMPLIIGGAVVGVIVLGIVIFKITKKK